jgi:UDP-N-acetylglucosamine 2-epimerase
VPLPPCDVALCYGTRPQVIKASVLKTELARRCRVLTVDTGQHYDYTLQALHYEQLSIAPPDVFLEVGSGSHAEQTAAVLTRVEAVLLERRPRAVVVIGGANSTLGSALAAAKLRIPVVHVEAGLRARDSGLAEEINRRAVTAVAKLLCTPSAATTRRVRAERPDAIVVETGDVSFDVLLKQAGHLPDPAGLLPTGVVQPYFFATLHRAQLTDNPELLFPVLAALNELERPVIVPVHPRTFETLESAGSSLRELSWLHFMEAVGYRDCLALIRGAEMVITDSGGVQREAYWLGIPSITVRDETEWEELVACGATRLVPPTAFARLPAVVAEQQARWSGGERWANDAYGTGHAARAVAAATTGLVAGSAASTDS